MLCKCKNFCEQKILMGGNDRKRSQPGLPVLTISTYVVKVVGLPTYNISCMYMILDVRLDAIKGDSTIWQNWHKQRK